METQRFSLTTTACMSFDPNIIASKAITGLPLSRIHEQSFMDQLPLKKNKRTQYYSTHEIFILHRL